MDVSIFECGPIANDSEKKAIEHLRIQLRSAQGDEKWVLLTNLSFSVKHQWKSDEIDIVAIGPPGVRVIEIKHWTAQWIKKNRSLVEHEAEKVTTKAKKIGTTLRKIFSNLGYVDGSFLLTQEFREVKQLSKEKVRGVEFFHLKNWKTAIGFDQQTELSSQQILDLSFALEPKSRVATLGSPPRRRLASFINLELQTPESERFCRVYKGIHATWKVRARLFLYDLYAGGKKAYEKSEREFKVIFKLQRFEWAPRVMASHQPVPGYEGEMYFFAISEPSAPSIRERVSDTSWDVNARLSYCKNSICALEQLHGEKSDHDSLVHRNLNPEILLVKHDNTPILTGFDRTKIPGEISVVTNNRRSAIEISTASPEVIKFGLSVADHRSDVYSLCQCLDNLFENDNKEICRKAKEIFAGGSAENPEHRSTLQQLKASLSELLGDPIVLTPPPSRYWTVDQTVPFRGREYRIEERLGSGGVGTAFKVVKINRETDEDLGTYVAKVGNFEEDAEQVLAAYERVHSHLGLHPELSAIYEVATEWKENEFIALMSWIEGVTLSDYQGVLSLLAEDYQEPSAESLAIRWIVTVCKGLRVLHNGGLVHGDVSPRNMIVSKEDIILTDYDFVCKIGDPFKISTEMYSPYMCVPHDEKTNPSNDIFSLAASFFHIVFDREPFIFDGNNNKRNLNWEEIDSEERSNYPKLIEFIQKAVHSDPAQRFKSIDEVLDTISDSTQLDPQSKIETKVHGETEEHSFIHYHDNKKGKNFTRREEKVEWLRSLLESYPGSRWGNRETRGLDTEFAKKTYVKTDFEKTLYDDLCKGNVGLVVLCGNAGDGKTALLQKLADRLGLDCGDSSVRIIEGVANNGISVSMNLDGSASWNGRSADDLLNEFLSPFRNGRTNEQIVHLLAINDGRLLEWLESYDDTLLAETLSRLIENKPRNSDSWVKFINLNQRSLVGHYSSQEKKISNSFLDSLIDQLYGGDSASSIWKPCQTCSAQERCEVFRAARIFGPTDLLEVDSEAVQLLARERLYEALQFVHLRGETHITVRELRATLVYILFGIHYCNDYHEGSGKFEYYWDRAFSVKSEIRQGEVLAEFVRFDPALEAHPKIDRYISASSSHETNNFQFNYESELIESERRRAFFEWSEEKIEKIANDRHALGLARGQHLRKFRNIVLMSQREREKLCERLCGGISHLENLPPEAMNSVNVPLRITPRTPTETAFWVYKPITSFQIKLELPSNSLDFEWLHRSIELIYKYRDGHEERLRLGAELFNLLLELDEGLQIGDVSTDSTYTNLSIFVQRLVQEDDREVFAWNPIESENIYQISIATEIHQPQQIVISTRNFNDKK